MRNPGGLRRTDEASECLRFGRGETGKFEVGLAGVLRFIEAVGGEKRETQSGKHIHGGMCT